MPGSKKTPNFDFPYYGPLDTFSPLVTYNGLAQRLDNILKTLQTKGEQNGTLISEVQDALDAVHSSVDANTALIEQINQSKDLWTNIFRYYNTTPTPAAGVESLIFNIGTNSNSASIFTLGCSITKANATITNGPVFKYIDILSFPETIPRLSTTAISYETAQALAYIHGYAIRSDDNARIPIYNTIYGYRNQNVSRIFTAYSDSDFSTESVWYYTPAPYVNWL